MDTVSLSGSLVASRNSQTREALSMSVMKMVSQQQQQISDMLAQGVKQGEQSSAKDNNYGFSVYV